MKKQLLALTAAITTLSALSPTPSAQAEIGVINDEEDGMYLDLLVTASNTWSGIPTWSFFGRQNEWIARGREACKKADNGISLSAQFEEAKRKGDRKTMLAIDSAHKAYCWDRHGSTSLMKRMGNYLGNL